MDNTFKPLAGKPMYEEGQNGLINFSELANLY